VSEETGVGEPGDRRDRVRLERQHEQPPGPGDRRLRIRQYVVSSTLEDPDWNNSTVLKGDVVDEVSKLKQELDGEIVVLGSPSSRAR
jgi:hypothetical protein